MPIVLKHVLKDDPSSLSIRSQPGRRLPPSEPFSSCLSFVVLAVEPSSSPTPLGQQNQAQLVLADCALPHKLNSQLWQELHLDEYLKAYPNGQHVSVQEFAKQNGAQSFLCGIGEFCNVGELCYPVRGLAWYTLFAVQEFNLFMNAMYKAVGRTMELVRSSLLMDLIQPPDSKEKYAFWLDTAKFLTAITVSLSFGLFISMGVFAADSAWLTVSALSAYLGTGSAAVLGGLTITSLVEKSKRTEPVSAFDYWSQFAFYLSQCEESMHQGIASTLKKTLESGISNTGPGSLTSLLAQGVFIEPRSIISLPEIEALLKEVTQVRGLVILLRSMNAFVTRGEEPCKGRGLNGAREEDNHLSFCGPDNIMMNVNFAHGDKLETKIYNAKSIAFKYSITTEYLTTNAWECQQKHGLEYDPYKYSALPMSTSAECLVNLPVCDCTRADIKAEIKRTNVVKACREVGKLQI
ncbi:hypothetical protein O181_069946 [Austropuccinia psidii MF-1]|uniref:DUF7872 domain-containing protein n=1 Tax=Austropuccinia psidii MF-1 TaxID=1389203 RepID=A0A9Q3I587_9BASI|nr:hypothetical protein [Austropuccinia psidii MF-1]